MKKKLLAILLVGAMVLSMAACGAKKEEPVAEEPAVEEPAAEEPVAEEPAAEEPAAEEAGQAYVLGALIYKYDDTYISTVRAALESYAAASSIDITLDMQDGQGDQAKQNDQLDVLIEKGVDAILINAVDTGSAQGLADKASAAGIPVIFFNREPAAEVVESASAIFVGTTASEAGVMQGDILADLVEAKPEIDKNDDGTIQFLVFKGEPGNPEAEARTEFAVSQSEARGLTMENLYGEAIVANWATDQAQSAMEAQMAAHDNIEVVFCNNDDMALGVIAALGDAAKETIVLGVDATDAGMEAVNNGTMAGTVKQDGDAMGRAVIALAENALQGRDFLEGTEYQMADDGFSVRIPYAAVK